MIIAIARPVAIEETDWSRVRAMAKSEVAEGPML
jgi:hypothetical protein